MQMSCAAYHPASSACRVRCMLASQLHMVLALYLLMHKALQITQWLVVPAGYNVCIFAYGQTGSGKTHTMAGTNIEQYSGRGINYRALDDLFALNEQRKGEVSIWHRHLCYFNSRPAVHTTGPGVQGRLASCWPKQRRTSCNTADVRLSSHGALECACMAAASLDPEVFKVVAGLFQTAGRFSTSCEPSWHHA